jgi:competence protein ComEA
VASTAATKPTSPSASTPGAAGSASTSQILVHVLGAVQRPGVVRLPERSRVQDAIEAAGGLRKEAVPGDLNLAAVLDDGQQLVIGTAKKPSATVRDDSAAPGRTAGPATEGSSAGVLNLNSASQVLLEGLPGVGPVTAAKIVAWRDQNGRFSRVEELQEVDGIGPKTYADIAPHVGV